MNFTIFNEFLLSLVIGFTQGITEFLPISSTAHIYLITNLITKGRDIGLNTSNIIQMGTLFAVLQYFRADLSRFYYRGVLLIKNRQVREQFINNTRIWVSGKDNFIGSSESIETDINIAQLAVGTIPIVIIALFLRHYSDSGRNFIQIATYLLAGSALMYFGEFMHNKVVKEVTTTRPKYMRLGEVLMVGLFQSLAIFPGVSRSGATIAGALLVGRDRPSSVRFSFLLSIPAILLSGAWDGLKYVIQFTKNPVFLPTSVNWSETTISLSLVTLILGVVTAYYVGFACLKWLIAYLSKHPVNYFIYYRLGLVVLIYILLASNVIN
jgi:undecaprenyl-diphosphatase